MEYKHTQTNRGSKMFTYEIVYYFGATCIDYIMAENIQSAKEKADKMMKNIKPMILEGAYQVRYSKMQVAI